MTRRGPGVVRRALVAAIKDAEWIGPADAATVRAAKDLADVIDDLRTGRESELQLHGALGIDSRAAWHSATVHGKFLAYLEALRLTPATRPAVLPDSGTDLVTQLRSAIATE